VSPDEFFREFVGLYVRARVPTFMAEGITRARCRSVSGGLEDLTAYYIATSAPGRFRVYVDQPVSVSGKVQYPDLVVQCIASGTVSDFVDVKTDLGWKRSELQAICRKLKTLSTEVAGKTVRLGDEPRTRQPVGVAAAARAHVVVGTWENCGEMQPEEAIQLAAAEGVPLYIFSEGRHPNHFSRSKSGHFPGLEVRTSDMERFVASIHAT
jgi:hypothetical protein